MQSTCALRIKKVPVRVRAPPEDKATEADTKPLRECCGALQWLAKESRPDLAVQVNMSQQAMSYPRVRDSRRANDVVRRAIQHHDLGTRFLPIPLKQLRLVLHSDAAFSMLVAVLRWRGMWWRRQMIGWLTERWHRGVCRHGGPTNRNESCSARRPRKLRVC